MLLEALDQIFIFDFTFSFVPRGTLRTSPPPNYIEMKGLTLSPWPAERQALASGHHERSLQALEY
jgi:hypothetical protein